MGSCFSCSLIPFILTGLFFFFLTQRQRTGRCSVISTKNGETQATETRLRLCGGYSTNSNAMQVFEQLTFKRSVYHLQPNRLACLFPVLSERTKSNAGSICKLQLNKELNMDQTVM